MQWVALGALIAMVIAIAATNVSSASDSPKAGVQTISLFTRATSINDFVDTGPSGASPGDIYVFSDRVFLATSPDDQVGFSDGRCVLIDPTAFRFDCSITTTLPDGSIMVAGSLILVEGATSTGAIVGGTGAYRLARGDGTVTLGPLEGPHQSTMRLVLNP